MHGTALKVFEDMQRTCKEMEMAETKLLPRMESDIVLVLPDQEVKLAPLLHLLLLLRMLLPALEVLQAHPELIMLMLHQSHLRIRGLLRSKLLVRVEIATSPE